MTPPPPPAERPRRVLIVVQNLPVPFDRRVWQIIQELRRAGHDVTVVCPTGGSLDVEREVWIDGVRILRYPLRPAEGGPAGYLREYGCALFHTVRLALRVRRAGPVDVVHVCNPPDLLFLAGLPLRWTGARLLFDHHDLVPELLESRFGIQGPAGRALRAATLLMERTTFAVADAVISTNESYRQVAIGRGRKRPDLVSVVRSAPNLDHFVRRPPHPAQRRGKRYLAAYLGVMGPQDGVDGALRALAHLRDGLGRTDLHTIFMGDGPSHSGLVELCAELGLGECVEFTGRVPDEFVQRCLSTADLCLSPDPWNPLNDVSTMNKVVEYMAMSRPIVSYELKEAQFSAGEAAVYVAPGDEHAFARAVDTLLDDPDRRQRMGAVGRRRVEDALSWATSSRALLSAYENLFALTGPHARGSTRRARRRSPTPPPTRR